ncbi:MAG: hypothetical protein RLZZ138_737, partial [Actinomycetota bacterium]
MAIQKPKANPLKALIQKARKPKAQKKLPLFEAMRDGETPTDSMLQRSAKDHLWMHFTRHSPFQDGGMNIIAKGDGIYLWDTKGHKVIDGLSGLFAVNAGHGRKELAEA